MKHRHLLCPVTTVPIQRKNEKVRTCFRRNPGAVTHSTSVTTGITDTEEEEEVEVVGRISLAAAGLGAIIAILGGEKSCVLIVVGCNISSRAFLSDESGRVLVLSTSSLGSTSLIKNDGWYSCCW